MVKTKQSYINIITCIFIDPKECAEATPLLSSHIWELPPSLEKTHRHHHRLALQAHQSLD